MDAPAHLPAAARQLGAAALVLSLGFGCVQPHAPPDTSPALSGTFASAVPVLERNCVHCHGDGRLSHMPPFNDSRALARLKGPSGWIVPGHPERSRFFNVVTFSDDQPGAMPPTGHAISKAEAALLRAWISAGAPVPEGPPIRLTPRGPAPRSS